MTTIISSIPEVYAQGTFYVGGSGVAAGNPGSITLPFLTAENVPAVTLNQPPFNMKHFD